jgi:hypothetical protein
MLIMNEDFLYYLWKYHLPGKTLTGSRNEEITIHHPGQQNYDSGPDFFNGKIKIDDTLWAGNIEIHTKSSDWYRHGHQEDPNYDNIILHVVYEDDRPVFRKNGEPVPTLVLKDKFDKHLFERYQGFLLSKQWIPCGESISNVGHFEIMSWLHRLAIERLERKAGEIEQMLHENKSDFREIFYRKLLRSYGFKTNAEAFEQLAFSLPFTILTKHKDNLLQIEALLFGQAGMLRQEFDDDYPRQLQSEYRFLAQKYQLKPMQPEAWRFMRMHPPNFPTIRLAQFARLFHRSTALLQKILEAERLSDVISLLQTETSDYWKTHFRFDKPATARPKKMGKASLHLILINTIIPFVFVYGKETNQRQLREKSLEWLVALPSEKNHITRNFSLLGIKPENALQSQALIRLKTVYCQNKQCLRCGVGHHLLKSV